MATFSMGDAIGSSFKLIGRRPLSVWAWGLAYFVLAGLPALLLFGWVAPDYLAAFHQFMQDGVLRRGEPPNPAMFLPMQMKFMTLQPVMFLSSIVGRAVLAGAVFRAVLEPRNKGFASLRLGAQELWLGLLNLAGGILAAIVIIAIALIAAAVGLGLAAALKAAEAATVWIVLTECAVCFVAFVVVIWLAVRFSLAGPMTFADREFRLFESWTVTKGHGWSLFFMAILLGVIVIALVMVVEGALFAAGVLTLGLDIHSLDQATVERFFSQSPETLLRTVAIWLVGLLLVGSFVGGAMAAIGLAPWAEAYRELTAGRAAPAAEPLAAAPVEEPQDDHGHSEADSHGDPHADDHDHHGH